MAQKKPAKKSTRKTAKSTTGLTAEERAAMKETMRERRLAGKGNGENMLLAKVGEMKEPDRSMAKRIHEIVKANAPELAPQTWYGMPAYAKEGKVVCYFQAASKFKARYATFGFNDSAKLDAGEMWPIAFALKKLTATEEAKIQALVKKAVR